MKTLLTLAFLTLSAITAAAQVVTAPDIHLSGPSEFNAVITAEGLSGIAAYQFDIYYDPEVITLQYGEEDNFGCSTTGISSGMAVQCNGLEAGRLRVIVFGAYPFSGFGDILNTQWVSSSWGESPLHFAHGRFFVWQPYGGEFRVEYHDGSVAHDGAVGIWGL